jgi:hypothetical protein
MRAGCEVVVREVPDAEMRETTDDLTGILENNGFHGSSSPFR